MAARPTSLADICPNLMNSTNGIVSFNPTTYENNFIPVNNFPVEGSYFFNVAPASVFVPSRNRIYCFGGHSKNASGTKSHDGIFIIDLAPLEPSTTWESPTTWEATTEPTAETISTTIEPIFSTTLNPEYFTCNNRTDGKFSMNKRFIKLTHIVSLLSGIYPHPTDCSLFIGCQYGEMTVFRCPPPLLFDPVTKGCDFPDQVQCGTSCQDKPDGTYPHPHDCALFVICRSEVPNIFKCPPPLLFDPVGLHCDFPEVVSCPIEA